MSVLAAIAAVTFLTMAAVQRDLAYTPPLGSPWDAIQVGAQAWVRHTDLAKV